MLDRKRFDKCCEVPQRVVTHAIIFIYQIKYVFHVIVFKWVPLRINTTATTVNDIITFSVTQIVFESVQRLYCFAFLIFSPTGNGFHDRHDMTCMFIVNASQCQKPCRLFFDCWQRSGIHNWTSAVKCASMTRAHYTCTITMSSLTQSTLIIWKIRFALVKLHAIRHYFWAQIKCLRHQIGKLLKIK